jgi:hypothetical protein
MVAADKDRRKAPIKIITLNPNTNILGGSK